MIDWHSHILPGMDDGSRNVAESISLINMQALQGVELAIATPHFYANDETVDSFLERRAKSFEILRTELTVDMPGILLGAEVRYYHGISHMPDLKLLKIENSKLLLLEMPTSTWTEYMIRELIEMSSRNSIQVILAHVDRYLSLQKKEVWERILQSGILIQSNADFFTSFVSKRRAVSFLEKGNIHFIGSDCHNVTSRPPQIEKAFEYIRKKLGDEFIYQMNEYGHSLLDLDNK